MNMKVFCSDCGFRMSYSGQRPKFCSNCGISLNSHFGGNTVASKRDKLVDLNDEVLEADISVPDINGLDVDIEPFQTHSCQFQDVLGASSGISQSPEQRPKLTKRQADQQKKQVLEQFKSDAGTTRGGKTPS